MFRKALQREYKVRPLLTSLGPMLANIPLLIIFSLSIRSALEAPGSPLALSPFLWIHQLGQADIALGIAGGMLTFLNSEVTRIRGENSITEITVAEEEMEANRRAKAESWKESRRAKREQQAMEIKERAETLLAQRSKRHVAKPTSSSDTTGSKRTLTTSSVLLAQTPSPRPQPNTLTKLPASATPPPVQEIRIHSPEAVRVARLTKFFENLGKLSALFIICLSTQVPSVSPSQRLAITLTPSGTSLPLFDCALNPSPSTRLPPLVYHHPGTTPKYNNTPLTPRASCYTGYPPSRSRSRKTSTSPTLPRSPNTLIKPQGKPPSTRSSSDQSNGPRARAQRRTAPSELLTCIKVARPLHNRPRGPGCLHSQLLQTQTYAVSRTTPHQPWHPMHCIVILTRPCPPTPL